MPKDLLKIAKIKELIKNECLDLGFVPEWFYSSHLLAVEKYAKYLLGKLPKANKEIVLLGVWLHDLQRIRGLKGDHQKVGAFEAKKVLREFSYDENIIKSVESIVLSHSCDKIAPEILEGKILATADAMSHYVNDFYLEIAVTNQRNLAEYKEWALEKLDRDYNKKIAFSFARKLIKKRHDTLKQIFTMK